ncbi:MAG: hypothetical protein HC933_14575 [Pleurocapsa sp. SU_196_0]|nr:hypothetical protein [Pleurocapsa sp. SU_196_0]
MESVKFYTELGFDRTWLWTEGGQRLENASTTQKVVYAGFDAPLEIHFTPIEVKEILENTVLRVQVAGDIAALYAHCQALGCVHPKAPLTVKPWGLREFGILDPSGVLIYFAQKAAS